LEYRVDGEELMFLLMKGTVESVEVANGNTLKPALLSFDRVFASFGR